MAKMLVVLMLVVVEVATAMAPSPGPAPAMDCMDAVMNLIDCLSFVQDEQAKTKPQGTCCSSLKNMLKKPEAGDCLCEEFKNSASLGISVNITKALSLPKACGLVTPSAVKNCAAISNAPGSEPSPVLGAAPDSSSNTSENTSSGKSVMVKLPFLILLPLVSSILLLIPYF
ncbi:Lipid transfer protein [Zostera marina]|uniref:Lipid transfer protein n=1 Tax=Zostera marina TaxID=29655 RepID=A0A0K9PIR4_ZOSMR|nr:Lipid transfer protein [Zostera marina]